jgi:hypothetical protein
MMLPLRCAFMTGATARSVLKTPPRSISITFRQASIGNASIAPSG